MAKSGPGEDWTRGSTQPPVYRRWLHDRWGTGRAPSCRIDTHKSKPVLCRCRRTRLSGVTSQVCATHVVCVRTFNV